MRKSKNYKFKKILVYIYNNNCFSINLLFYFILIKLLLLVRFLPNTLEDFKNLIFKFYL